MWINIRILDHTNQIEFSFHSLYSPNFNFFSLSGRSLRKRLLPGVFPKGLGAPNQQLQGPDFLCQRPQRMLLSAWSPTTSLWHRWDFWSECCTTIKWIIIGKFIVNSFYNNGLSQLTLPNGREKLFKMHHNPWTTSMVFSLFKSATVTDLDLTALKGATTARTISVMHLAHARSDAGIRESVLQERDFWICLVSETRPESTVLTPNDASSVSLPGMQLMTMGNC